MITNKDPIIYCSLAFLLTYIDNFIKKKGKEDCNHATYNHTCGDMYTRFALCHIWRKERAPSGNNYKQQH